MFYVWILELMDEHTDRLNSATMEIFDIIFTMSHEEIYNTFRRYRGGD